MSAISIPLDVPVRSRLRCFIRGHLPKLIFALYNLPSAVFGAGLYVVEVQQFGHPVVMHAINLPLTTLLAYCTNRQVPTWKNRVKSRAVVAQALSRRQRLKAGTVGLHQWCIYSLGEWGIKQAMFILFVIPAALPAIWVNPVQVLGFGLVNYFVNDRKVFPKEEETANGVGPG
jgi:hypothetical protein